MIKEADACITVSNVAITFQSSLCGYQIRMENLSGEWTRLLYCTTGVLLRKLQHDRHLSSLTHIIVDEVLIVIQYLITDHCNGLLAGLPKKTIKQLQLI